MSCKMKDFHWYSANSAVLLSDSEHLRSYTHLDVQLGASLESTPPWFAAVYSSSGPLQYTVKAWCSGMKLFRGKFPVLVGD